MVMLKYIVVGTGRCGTTYLSRMFNFYGIKCGHENIFTPYGYNKAIELLNKNSFEAESSWLSAPFLDSDLLKNSAIIHIVRDPEKTISSFINVKLFSKDNIYQDFINEFIHIKDFPVELRDVIYFIKWNEFIINKSIGKRYIFHRVEDNIEILFNKLGLKLEKPIDNRFSNKTTNTIKFSLDDINNERIKEMLIDMKKEFGYND